MATSVIDHIRGGTITAISSVISPGSDVALLDFPNYVNAGDVMIYRGEIACLSALDCSVEYLSDMNTYDATTLAARVPNGPILLQGGGNFGDRYPVNQLFREKVVSEHPDRQIVSLPQSFDFSDAHALARARTVYARHPDLTIMIRDRASVSTVAQEFPSNSVCFCPDMAFSIGPLRPSREPDHDVVLLKRSDGEAAHSAETIPSDLVRRSCVHDWRLDWFGDDLRWWPSSMSLVLLSKISAIRRRIHPWSGRTFDKQSAIIMNNAVDMFSRGRIVVTDRLHAAILAVLLDKPAVLVDNVTGKVSAAYRDYFHAIPDVHLTADFAEASAVVEKMLGSP